MKWEDWENIFSTIVGGAGGENAVEEESESEVAMWSDMSFTAPMKRKYRHLLFLPQKFDFFFYFFLSEGGLCFTRAAYERLVLGAKPTEETVLIFSIGNTTIDQQCSTH